MYSDDVLATTCAVTSDSEFKKRRKILIKKWIHEGRTKFNTMDHLPQQMQEEDQEAYRNLFPNPVII